MKKTENYTFYLEANYNEIYKIWIVFLRNNETGGHLGIKEFKTELEAKKYVEIKKIGIKIGKRKKEIYEKK